MRDQIFFSPAVTATLILVGAVRKLSWFKKELPFMRLWVILFLMLSTIVLLPARDASGQGYAGQGGAAAMWSVFRVRCRLATPTGHRDIDLGTGFGHKSGNVLSANHVVEPCPRAGGSLQLVATHGIVTSAVIYKPDDTIVSNATIVKQDDTIDLALLKPETKGFVKSPLVIAPGSPLNIGSQVSSWGFPFGYSGSMPLLTVGHVAGISVEPRPNNRSMTRWVVNAAFNKGNSGGPLLDARTATVIGVVIQKFSPLTTEVSSKLQDLLKSGGPESKVLAQSMLDIAQRAQLVIGLCVSLTDLEDFLRSANIEP
jgi:S1-C subfamily serine protease